MGNNKHSDSFEFGSKTTSVYTERQVRVFAIHEPELDMLSNFNDISIVCFSIGTWLLSIAYDKYEQEKVWSWLIVGLICYAIGSILWFYKKGITNRIKNESKTINLIK